MGTVTVNARKCSPDASEIHLEFCIIRSFIHSINVYWAHNTLCLALLAQAMQLALLFACWGSAPQLVFCSSFLQLFRSSCSHLQGYLQISSWPAPLRSGLSSKITSSEGLLWPPSLKQSLSHITLPLLCTALNHSLKLLCSFVYCYLPTRT